MSDTPRTTEQRRLEAALTAACAEIAVVRGELRQLREAAAGVERATEEWREDYATALAEHTRRCTSMPLDGLLTAFAELERGTEPIEILSELVTALSREFSRVALCVIRDQDIAVVEHRGFMRDETKPLVMSDAAHACVVRAIESKRMEVSMAEGGDGQGPPAIEGAAGCRVAIPFVIGQDTSAVVYADDSDMPGFATSMPHARIKFAELLRMHAGVLIQRATERDDPRQGRLRVASCGTSLAR